MDILNSRKIKIAFAVILLTFVGIYASDVVVTAEQILDFGKWVLGMLLLGHTATDVAQRIRRIGVKPEVAEAIEDIVDEIKDQPVEEEELEEPKDEPVEEEK